MPFALGMDRILLTPRVLANIPRLESERGCRPNPTDGVKSRCLESHHRPMRCGRPLTLMIRVRNSMGGRYKQGLEGADSLSIQIRWAGNTSKD